MTLLNLVKIRASQINHCACRLVMHSKDALAAERIIQLNTWTESKDFSTAKEIGSASTAGVRRTAPPRVPRRPPFSSSPSCGTFGQLGAKPWYERALNEVRATRITGPRRTGAGVSPLTPQQREIAEPTASGLAAKQIGEEGLRHRRWSEPTDRAA
jgi:hypothetical protein